ncbi:MAG: YlxM family DNA-binding protein [Syntrophomonadaceae bacterium]|nr:YlxM family DNA-binding protein [Syntrophomonadaceae bacterium]
MLEKMEQVILLKDFYGPLLTPKQQEVLNLHYEQDWSLSEIAEHWQISRQAVFDLIKRSQNALQDYEDRLHLVKKFNFTRQKIDEAYSLLNSSTGDEVVIKQVQGILKTVSESI